MRRICGPASADQRIAGSVDLRIGEGPFSILHNYPESKAFSSLRAGPGRGKGRTRARSCTIGRLLGVNCVQNVLDGSLGVEHHGDVAHHNGEPRRTSRGRGSGTCRQRVRRRARTATGACGSSYLLQPARMQLADPARAACRRRARRAERPGCSAGCAARLEAQLRAARHERLEVALDVEEIDRALGAFPLLARRRAVGQPRRCASAGARRATESGPSSAPGSRRNTRPDLEHAHARHLAVHGCTHHVDQRADQRSSASPRCWLAIGLSRRIGSALPAKSRSQRRLDEAEVDHLLVVRGRQPLAQDVQPSAVVSGAGSIAAAARGGCAPGCARSRGCAPPPRSGPPRSRGRSGSVGGVTVKRRRRRCVNGKPSRVKHVAPSASAATGMPITFCARATRMRHRLALRAAAPPGRRSAPARRRRSRGSAASRARCRRRCCSKSTPRSKRCAASLAKL